MFRIKRCSSPYLKAATPSNLNESLDGYITTLRPEGSFDGTRMRLKKRELVRPKINYWKTALNVLIPMIICVIICRWSVFYAFVSLGLYSLIRLRGIMIWFIHIYQRYASEDIRLSCVYEPSCSEYMILSIKKYNVVYGCIKGIKRLLRCHFPNGGIDYP